MRRRNIEIQVFTKFSELIIVCITISTFFDPIHVTNNITKWYATSKGLCGVVEYTNKPQVILYTIINHSLKALTKSSQIFS